MNKILNESERDKLLLQHRRERDRRVADRIKAVLLRDEGWTYAEISHALFLSEDSIKFHLQDYISQNKLKPENGGSVSLLNSSQTVALLAHLDVNLFVKVAEICTYVKAAFNVIYTVNGMTNWLKRNEFTYHKPCGVPAKADAKAQAEFVSHYEKIKSGLGVNDQILFMDGVHPSHCVRFVRGWMRKGVRREIPTNASQKRINILGTLNLETMSVYYKDYQTINSDSIVCFLSNILKNNATGLIHIILDRARYHTCSQVHKFCQQNKRLRLHFLPPYSPNINAIEPLWKIMHEYTTNNRFYPNFKSFTENIHGFFKTIVPKNIHLWTDKLTDNFRLLNGPIPA